MTLTDDLIAARGLIDTPEKWGKGDGAFTSPPAPLLCAVGACAEARRRANRPFFFELTRALIEHVPEGMSVFAYNDAPSTTHADVLALFDRAISASRTKDASHD